MLGHSRESLSAKNIIISFFIMSKGSWLFLSAIYIKEYKHQIKCNQHGRKKNVGLKAAKKQNGQKGQRRVPAEGQEAKASTHTSTFEYPPLRSSYETHAYVHIHMRNSQPVITVLHAYSIYWVRTAFSAFFSCLWWIHFRKSHKCWCSLVLDI